jgi:hypothetical protein
MILGGNRGERLVGQDVLQAAGRCVKITLPDQAQMKAIGGCVLSRAGSRGI